MERHREQHLDGLRGLACIAVVTMHYSTAFLPGFHVFLIDNGRFDVALFFLISGFVLTRSVEKSPNSIMPTMAARLVRLGLPVLASFAFGAAVIGATYHLTYAAGLMNHSAVLLTTAHMPLFSDLWRDVCGYTLLFGYRDSALFPFVPGALHHVASVNPVTWTISYEIWGTLWICVLVWLRARARSLYIATIFASFIACLNLWIFLFTIGHLLTFVRHKHPLSGAAAMLAGVLLYHNMPIIFDMSAILIFSGLLMWVWPQRILGSQVCQYLGRVSFAIYLVHWPIMTAFGSSLYLLLGGQSVIVLLLGIAVTLPVANLFEKYIDAPAIVLSRRIKRRLIMSKAQTLDSDVDWIAATGVREQ